jgi:hypothetical protein
MTDLGNLFIASDFVIARRFLASHRNGTLLRAKGRGEKEGGEAAFFFPSLCIELPCHSDAQRGI